MNKTVLAVDLGGTNMRMAAVGSDGNILFQTRTSTPSDVNPGGLIGLFSRLAAECRDAIGHEYVICAIAAGVPANINSEGILHNLPNLPSIEGMNLKSDLEREFGVPAVLENDATAAAIGEDWLGASRSVKDSILLTLGTGVGGGIILGNLPVRGMDGTAGKIGHMNVEPEGVPCGCGSRGCIEQYASATAIVRLAREAGLDAATSQQVYEARTAGDPKATGVFNKVGYYLGITIGDLLNLLNPEMVLIGGGAAGAWDAFIEPMTAEIRERAFSEPVRRAQIVRSELGDNAGILGAARSALLSL